MSLLNPCAGGSKLSGVSSCKDANPTGPLWPNLTIITSLLQYSHTWGVRASIYEFGGDTNSPQQWVWGETCGRGNRSPRFHSYCLTDVLENQWLLPLNHSPWHDCPPFSSRPQPQKLLPFRRTMMLEVLKGAGVGLEWEAGMATFWLSFRLQVRMTTFSELKQGQTSRLRYKFFKLAFGQTIQSIWLL